MTKKQILMVDDDRDFLNVLQVRLEGYDFQVSGVTDVMGALQAVEKQAPDLVILDIGLPVGNGILLLRKFRSMDSLKNVPVIVLTARRPNFLREESFKYGATAFFQKPADNEALLSTIRKALGESSRN